MGKITLKTLFVTTMIISILFCSIIYSIEAVDIIITDETRDVISIDFLTATAEVITYHPDINVDNLDLVQATYTKQEAQATVSVQVKGNIENRGELIDPYDS